MSTPHLLMTGDRRAGVHIAYVKSRRVLRVGGWHGESERLESVEMPLRTFLERLDIDGEDLDVPRRYLIFSGEGAPVGGARDLTGVFDCEEEARAAFHRLRAQRRSSASWAQLVLLDHRGRSKALCWFDADPSAVAVADTADGTRGRRVRSRPWARLKRRP